MVRGDRVRDGLQHHRFSGAWRSDDQSALSLADGAEHVQNSSREVFLGGFQANAIGWIQRRQVVEKYLAARDFRVFKVDGFDLDQREVALAVLWRAHLAGYSVASAQIESADLRRGDVDVVRARQVIVFGRAQEAESIREAFQHAFGEDQAVLFRLGAENLEDQLLLPHPRGAGNVQFLGYLRQIGNVLIFQFCKANAHRFRSFSSLVFRQIDF